jgi:hypothetical protein
LAVPMFLTENKYHKKGYSRGFGSSGGPGGAGLLTMQPHLVLPFI